MVYDAAGVGGAMSDSVAVMAPRGSVVVVDIHEKPFDFVPTSLLDEVSVVGCLVYQAADYEAVIANMAAGVYDTTGWVNHTSLDDLEKRYDELRAGRRMKILVDPDGPRRAPLRGGTVTPQAGWALRRGRGACGGDARSARWTRNGAVITG